MLALRFKLHLLLSILQELSTFTLEKAQDGGVKMETGKGKCPFEPSQHYAAVMAGGGPAQLTESHLYFMSAFYLSVTSCHPPDGTLYTAATSNFLGTLFDISRATGPEQERIRTEQSINWLNGNSHAA